MQRRGKRGGQKKSVPLKRLITSHERGTAQMTKPRRAQAATPSCMNWRTCSVCELRRSCRKFKCARQTETKRGRGGKKRDGRQNEQQNAICIRYSQNEAIETITNYVTSRRIHSRRIRFRIWQKQRQMQKNREWEREGERDTEMEMQCRIFAVVVVMDSKSVIHAETD